MHRALAEAIELFRAGLTSCRRAEDRASVERFLAELAQILSGAVLGEHVLDRVHHAERSFGHSWLIDQTPFEPAIAKWREFVAEYETFVVRGMTVNERLHAFALSEAYDRAVAARDTEAIRSILKRLHVDEESVDLVVARFGD